MITALLLRCATRVAFWVCLGYVSAPAALANPDVWVKTKHLLTFDETMLTGLDLTWRFDPFLSSRAILQFDSDQDGRFSDSESSALRAALFDPLADIDYFVKLTANDAIQPLRLTGFAPSIDAEQLVFDFTLALDSPQEYRQTPLAFGTYDDEMYFDFSFADADFLRVEGPFDTACRFRVQAGEGALAGRPQTITLLCPE